MKIVTVFAQPFDRATGYIMLDSNGRYCWKIGGAQTQKTEFPT